MRLSRRELLRLSGGALLAAPFLSGCDGGTEGSAGGLRGSRVGLPEPFTRPLPIPAVLQPVRRDGSTDYYEITQRAARAEILPRLGTGIWAYNGTFPGPTIMARSGRRTVLHHRNELPVPVSVHLHGGRTPPEHDGHPTDLLLPAGWRGHVHPAGGRVTSGSRDYVYPLDQPAATLWYHDHRMDFTGPQVYRGLAGFFLVSDEHEDALPLPRGERDIPLMICDRAFTADGEFDYPSLDPTLSDRPGVTDEFMAGVLGDVILVNGAPWPTLDVSNTRYRLRFLNASNARRYRLALDPAPPEGAAFTQIGSDVGLLDRPLDHDAIEIAPAERFDVVVDFSRYPIGTRISLSNEFGADSTSRIMSFHVARRARDDSTVPARLIDSEPVDPSAATVHRMFVFDRRGRDRWTINGATFDPERDDARPQLGATEIWRFDGDTHHPVHLHLAHFRILSRNGHPPGRYDAGWKDTMDLQSGREIEVLVRFTGYRGRYVFHCHNLEHEDMGMMASFSVT